jgi:hypothetical protein
MRFANEIHACARFTLVVCVLALTCISGCARTASQTGFMSSVEDVDATTGEMRQRTHDATVRFAVLIAQTGEQVMRQTDDPRIRQNALRFKASGVSMVHQAGFHFDPLIGLLDLGVLAYQMDTFFASGPGADAFGEQQSLVLAGLERITADLKEEARAVIDTARIDVPGDFIRT